MARSLFALCLIGFVGAQNILCITEHCTPAMLECQLNRECNAGLLCIIGCSKYKDQDDYNSCTIHCNYGYADEQFIGLITCMADHGCVPAIKDTCPPNPKVVPTLNLPDFEGTWYISLGLNKAIDCYDCQKHYFTPVSNGLYVEENFKLPPGYDVTYPPAFEQTYEQQGGQQAVMMAYESYQNDTNYWYIPGTSSTLTDMDSWFIVFYCGDNVGWHNYHGVLVYTRSPTLPESQRSAIKAVLSNNDVDIGSMCEAGVDMTNTKNCSGIPPAPTPSSGDF